VFKRFAYSEREKRTTRQNSKPNACSGYPRQTLYQRLQSDRCIAKTTIASVPLPTVHYRRKVVRGRHIFYAYFVMYKVISSFFDPSGEGATPLRHCGSSEKGTRDYTFYYNNVQGSRTRRVKKTRIEELWRGGAETLINPPRLDKKKSSPEARRRNEIFRLLDKTARRARGICIYYYCNIIFDTVAPAATMGAQGLEYANITTTATA